jgi:hypothetical protein
VKVSLTFEIVDEAALRRAYERALKTSGFSPEEQAEKLADMNPAEAIVECIANAANWEKWGISY